MNLYANCNLVGRINSVAQSCLTLRPHGLQHARIPCPSNNYQSLLKLMSNELVMPSNHLILHRPLLLLPSIFPCTTVFSNESVLCIRWPKYWRFSFSISPSNEYSGLISLGWTDWISLLSKGLSGSSPTPQLKSINSLALSSPTVQASCHIHT